MADNRTGLSAADLAKSFRDMAGDGSMEWVTGPMQTWLLLDAADMLDENAELRKERDFYFNQVTENGERAQRAIDALNDENHKLRELVRDVMPIVCNGCHERLCEMPKEEHPFVTCSFADRMRELGVTDHD